MSKILLATESVADPSSLRRLVAIADILRQNGHETVLAAGDLLAGSELANGHALLPAPVLPPGRRPAVAAAGYLGLLIDGGFLDAAALQILTAGCDTLLAQTMPSAIVLDRAPVLALASWGGKRLLVGEGAHLPPPGYDRLQSLDGDRQQGRADSMHELIMGALLRVQNRRARAAPECPADLFAGSQRMIATLAEFDPFVSQREDRNIGPLHVVPTPADLSAEPRYVAIFDRDYPNLSLAIEALALAKAGGEIYVPELPERLRRLAQHAGITVHLAGWPDEPSLRRARLVIHHGEMTAIESLLALGRAQVLLARDPEQIARGQVVASRGIGAVAFEAEHMRALGKIAARLLDDQTVGERAYAWARTLQEDFNRDGAAIAADAAERLALAG